MGNFTRKSIIEQVATAIDLGGGMWAEKFPSIRKLVAHYDVSLITVFKAVSLLAEKGVLVSAGPNRPFKVNPLIKERTKTLSAKTSAETKPALPLSAIRELANAIERTPRKDFGVTESVHCVRLLLIIRSAWSSFIRLWLYCQTV